MSSLYEKPLFKNRAKELAITIFTGNIRKSLFRQVVKLIPGAGSIAGSLTLGLGDAIKYAYENNIELVFTSTKTSLALRLNILFSPFFIPIIWFSNSIFNNPKPTVSARFFLFKSSLLPFQSLIVRSSLSIISTSVVTTFLFASLSKIAFISSFIGVPRISSVIFISL